MVFHLNTELRKRSDELSFAADSTLLTDAEHAIIKEQIAKNARTIDIYMDRIDLFVNQEGYPKQERFIEKLRKRMELLMAENNTFREVLWQHWLAAELAKP